jgi:hypothetical protein
MIITSLIDGPESNEYIENDLKKLQLKLYNYSRQIIYSIFEASSMFDIPMKMALNFFQENKDSCVLKGSSELVEMEVLLRKGGIRFVILQQSYVRRFLAKQKSRRKRKELVLMSILMAPPNQVEEFYFPVFPGGSVYHMANQSFARSFAF